MSRFVAILSGGLGERFWPASTPDRPKQLMPLLGPRTMLRETVERVSSEYPPERILIVTSAALALAVERECPEIPSENVIGEPSARNTAAAVATAACLALARGGAEAALAVLPADHQIRDRAAFLTALGRAFEAAEAEPLIVTLGIRPDRAETGYGYITRGEPLGDGVFRIEAFHEKPDPPTAAALVASGRSFWNAGLFIARAATLVEEIRRHAPALGQALNALLGAERSGWEPALREAYERAPSISFDHAIMERTRAGAVLPADIGWDDMGSWEAVARFLEPDQAGNVMRGSARVLEARNNILFADGGRITLIGADDLVVVRAGSETFVCARDRLPRMKELLARLDRSAGGPAEGTPLEGGGGAGVEGDAHG
ncbi:MAG TPA: sugar phosphate nucleotidyltransferase [Gemmatimonadota bacterium]